MQKKYSDISAIILAGGNSFRFGENKAFAKFGSRTIIEIIASRLSEIFSKIYISANEPDLYSFLNYEIVADVKNNLGPLSGVYSGLLKSTTSKMFIISCDLPLIQSTSIKYIVDNSKNYQITLPLVSCIPQYVCGVYDKNIIPLIENMLVNEKNEKPSLKALINLTKVNLLDFDKSDGIEKYGFHNMNTLDDYNYIKSNFIKYLK